jgi:hypothetical protein
MSVSFAGTPVLWMAGSDMAFFYPVQGSLVTYPKNARQTPRRSSLLCCPHNRFLKFFRFTPCLKYPSETAVFTSVLGIAHTITPIASDVFSTALFTTSVLCYHFFVNKVCAYDYTRKFTLLLSVTDNASLTSARLQASRRVAILDALAFRPA